LPAWKNDAVAGVHGKRPDIVLYVNGIALGVLELKRSTISVTQGIRQNLDNQKKEFIRPFFATVQLLMAGNDPEGLFTGYYEPLLNGSRQFGGPYTVPLYRPPDDLLPHLAIDPEARQQRTKRLCVRAGACRSHKVLAVGEAGCRRPAADLLTISRRAHV
jgi:membrane-bound lytic murein transglycosylase